MDVLVAEAKVINRRVPESSWQVACLAPNVKMLQVGWGARGRGRRLGTARVLHPT